MAGSNENINHGYSGYGEADDDFDAMKDPAEIIRAHLDQDEMLTRLE